MVAEEGSAFCNNELNFAGFMAMENYPTMKRGYK
jgi:hypothetical protein